MGVLTEVTNQVFDVNEIGKGDLIYARHNSWPDGRSGIVIDVSADELTVQYFPQIGMITNHYIMKAGEVAAGKWEIRWSQDLTDIREITLA